MLSGTRSSIQSVTTRLIAKTPNSVRSMTTQAQPKLQRKEGDISSVFVSLSGVKPEPLPERFANIKRQLIRGHEERLSASWQKLLKQLATENETVKRQGPGIIPQIQFNDLGNASKGFIAETKKRGVAVIKGVIPEEEARGYKTEVEEYVKLNPWTKGTSQVNRNPLIMFFNSHGTAFPAHDPQVYELYWSAPQVKARAHPNMLEAQTWLMKLWHSNDKDALISTSQPLTYADRVRIRQPGDSSFALGPHVDGGSVERWEPDGYGLGGVYDKIFQGKWEEYDPWESSCRIPAVSDLYGGSGSCSMFRMFQGWLGLSHTAPKEGTLMVNPLLQLATAYFLLRPFFEPRNISEMAGGQLTPGFLSANNWRLKNYAEMPTELHGANPGSGQELNDAFHPHLNLTDSMVHIPKITPGDFVVWHCDSEHFLPVKEWKADISQQFTPSTRHTKGRETRA